MVDPFLIYVLPSVVAVTLAIISFVLVFFSFRTKPWNLKGWLLVSVFFWIPWAGFTILMRYEDDSGMALNYLRLSFISLQIFLYSMFRFHHLMVFKPTDNRLGTFGLAIIMGFNIALCLNPTYLSVIEVRGYYTDKFHPFLMLGNMAEALWAVYWTFQALNQMDALALFYDKEGKKATIPVVLLLGLMPATFVAFAIWFLSDGQTDSTPFIVLVIIGFTFLGVTYGVNPNSKILAPQRLWGFIMVDKSGLPVFEHHFSKDERIGELALLAMAITASNTIVVANLQSGSYVNEVVLRDRAVLIEEANDLKFCLFADHPSLQLQIVLKEVVKRITTSREFKVPKSGQKYGTFNYVEDIINDIFSTESLDTRMRRRREEKL